MIRPPAAAAAKATAAADEAEAFLAAWRAAPARAPQWVQETESGAAAVPEPAAGCSPSPAPRRQEAAGRVPPENRSLPGAAFPLVAWQHTHLTATGPADAIAAFRAAAAGVGVIPWPLDRDRLAEDWFDLLAELPPQRRSLSVPACRSLARALAGAAARRHEAACTRVGRSKACPLDLHALVPVPPEILAAGAAAPAARLWLAENWGTSLALARVEEEAADPGEAGPSGPAFRVGFWSADWTPWQAFRTVAQRWPELSFALRPSYPARGGDLP